MDALAAMIIKIISVFYSINSLGPMHRHTRPHAWIESLPQRAVLSLNLRCLQKTTSSHSEYMARFPFKSYTVSLSSSSVMIGSTFFWRDEYRASQFEVEARVPTVRLKPARPGNEVQALPFLSNVHYVSRSSLPNQARCHRCGKLNWVRYWTQYCIAE